jgi:hypothetical protein
MGIYIHLKASTSLTRFHGYLAETLLLLALCCPTQLRLSRKKSDSHGKVKSSKFKARKV